jgi:hypothetical protein
MWEYDGVIGGWRHLGMWTILGFLPCARRVLGLTEGSMMETVEGFYHIPWHGDVHGVAIVIPCHVHSQVEQTGPIDGDYV